MTFSPQQLLESLKCLPKASRFLVAYSGGVDSHVLLHALVQLRHQQQQIDFPPLHAVHIHHGLHDDAERWTQHCQQICDVLEVPLQIVRVNAVAASGESPEDAARRARYAAITGVMQGHDALLTAHHQDDQAETLLLQLLRGSGPHGLAAMPQVTAYGCGWHARPLLGVTRSGVREYAERNQLRWVEDSSNTDTDYDRNYLRHEIMPRLRERWPSAAATLSRTALHCADAARLIDQCAHEDLLTLRCPEPDQLPVQGLLQLDDIHRRNVLRGWLESLHLPLPSTRHMQHIIHDVLQARADAVPLMRWPGAEIRRHRDRIYAMSPLCQHDARQVLAWDVEEVLELPSLGRRLTLQPSQQSSSQLISHHALDISALHKGDVTVRFRRGGEQCHPAGRSHSRDLKRLFQELDLPPWLRDRIPLIYVGETLAAIVGLLVCEGFQCRQGQGGVLPVLEPSAG